MALTQTSIAAALGANDLVLSATSATGATVGGFAKVDGEYMIITAISGTYISVRSRGDLGTAAVAHNILAPLTFGLLSDLNALPPGDLIPPVFETSGLVTVGANGAIAAPDRNTIYVITKASALGSSTLANPAVSQNGLTLTFTSATAAAHVVTLVNGNDGTTGNHTTFTFAAFKGAGFTVVAVNGEWNVTASVGVTIT